MIEFIVGMFVGCMLGVSIMAIVASGKDEGGRE